MLLDAAHLARGWLSVYTATGADTDQPMLYKTVHIEQHTHGLRLAATDSYMILTCWVPEKLHEYDDPAGYDEIPYARATVIDRHGRGHGLLAHLLKLAGGDDPDSKDIDISVRLNVPWQPEEHGTELQIEGFEALAVSLEHPGHERVQLEVYEGDYVNWRPIAGRQRNVKTDAIGMSGRIMGRLAKAAKLHDDLFPVRCWFGGRDKPVQVQFGDLPEITGLVMPVRWDFDRDAPYGEAEDEQC